jgi:hypothetical protein
MTDTIAALWGANVWPEKGCQLSIKHQEILTDYFENNMSLEILEAKHGRSTVQIGRLVRQAEQDGRVRTGQPKDRRGIIGAEPLSKAHKRIGMRFIRWRDNTKRMTTGQAALYLGLSPNRYASLEAGIHHISLLEMVFICEKLGWTLSDLLTTADTDDAKIHDTNHQHSKVA